MVHSAPFLLQNAFFFVKKVSKNLQVSKKSSTFAVKLKFNILD